MAARGYEFYLRVLQVSLTSERGERVRDTFSTSFRTQAVENDTIPILQLLEHFSLWKSWMVPTLKE